MTLTALLGGSAGESQGIMFNERGRRCLIPLAVETSTSAEAESIVKSAFDQSIYLRRLSPTRIGISLDRLSELKG